MGVAPEELHPVFAHRQLVQSLHILGYGVWVQGPFPAHLVHAIGARAPQAQITVREGTTVGVFPQDYYGIVF